MKKVITILIVGMLVMGSAAMAAEEKESDLEQATQRLTKALEKLAVDFIDLITKKIPETSEMLSATGTKKSVGSDK